MTNAELKTKFLELYDAITNFAAPGYTDSEISAFLNQGMDIIVDELYGAGDVANLAEILEKSTSNVVACTIENYGSYAYQPSVVLTDFRWHVNSRAKIARTEPFLVNTEWVECQLISKYVADKYVQTSFNKPIIVYPKLIRQDNTFVILIDSYSTINITGGFQLLYIKTPVRIDVSDTLTPELHVRLHQKIVDKAVQLAMKAVDVQRAQAEIQVNSQI